MCFFDKNDLYNIVSDEKLFSTFRLLERERNIIFARVVKRIKYKHLAPALDISISCTGKLYKRGILKMKKQMVEGLTNGKE
jgi:hypothetical protein